MCGYIGILSALTGMYVHTHLHIACSEVSHSHALVHFVVKRILYLGVECACVTTLYGQWTCVRKCTNAGA